MIEIIEIWKEFGLQIHQDFLLDYPDFWSGVKEIVNDFTLQEKLKFKVFLEDVQAKNLSKAELVKVWNQSGSEISFTKNGIKDVFANLLTISKK